MQRRLETVFDARRADIRVPALVAANSGDRCDVAPPEDVGIGRHDGLAIEVQVLAIVIAEIRYFK
jgi:hypothetical protein